ncbi:MAG: hypothetical protein RBR16_04205 [Syntrophus sp. (in: bacteria)]|nr:hypothetical protein [Syntrophus sp. (in: bacteria)]
MGDFLCMEAGVETFLAGRPPTLDRIHERSLQAGLAGRRSEGSAIQARFP